MTSSILSAITLYPVKSLAGISVSSWPVVKTGLLYDRKWMLVDAAGHFLSQRKLPKMALIKTALTESHLILSASGMASLSLPLIPTDGDIISSTIWHDQCEARSVSKEADQWLSYFLKLDCRLVYQPAEMVRPVDPRYADATDNVSFADGFPFLIISENSLMSLNQAMHLNLSMTRFRPNLVISGCVPYAEDSWREISIGAIDFRLTKPCSRCSVPAIDPESAQTGKEPLTTLNRIRKWENKIYFGQNALHNQLGTLTVGDTLHVKVTGAKQPPI
ncbi:MOSC domain-containing protein [Methylobacter psychrophilus]|uniref:MOSC domain-containing protein n=1 Tax=Methylobacter psychrophilus TaxID=96941 RepID=UPI0021D4B3FC|nr:MOSC N-terminal beta barrel domain-containing protein [Methylobacter psychrophilus]